MPESSRPILANLAMLLSLAAICVVGGWGLLRRSTSPAAPRGGPSPGAQRIVSLTPSITEVLFALELGDRVVGVTQYCDHPPEARRLPHVGGFLDPNYEAIVALRPDVAMMIPESQGNARRLEQLGVATLIVEHWSVAEIVASFRTIGEYCGVGERGSRLAAHLAARIESLKRNVPTDLRPGVLVCVGRSLGQGKLENLYVAGSRTFYDEIIALAGGVNIVEDTTSYYPAYSLEALLERDPDVIIDLIADIEKTGLEADALRRDWNCLPELEAVRNDRIHIFTADYVSIPGPRVVRLLEDVVEAVAPAIPSAARPSG